MKNTDKMKNDNQELANMDKYFVYCRKSSEAEDRQVLSIDSQTKELRELAAKLKIEIINPLYKESRSAKSPGRPEFTKMMERLIKGEAKGIICWKLDRLARNPIDGGSVIWAIKQNGIEIVTPAQTFNQQNENSILMYIEFGMAQKFVDDLSKNVKRGLKTKAEKGWLPSGAKAGYKNDKTADKGNKKLYPDPKRFALIRKAWDLMLTGTHSPMKVLRILNNKWSYRTPKHKKIGGKPMSRSQIYKTFTDPFYYGEFEYQGIWYEGKHKKMITREEYDRVQLILGKKGHPRPKRHDFTFTGLLRCGECDASITAEEKHQIICSSCKHKFSSVNKTTCPHCQTLILDMEKPTRLHYVYYHCTKRKKKTCTQKSIRLEDFEAQFDNLLERVQISETFKSWAIKHLNELSDIEIEDRNAIIKSQQSAYDDCVKRIDNLVKLKISPQNTDGELLSDKEFKEQKDALMKEKNGLMSKLKGTDGRINRWIELTEQTFEFACYARHWFAAGDKETKKQILLGIGSNLELKDGIVQVELQKPLQFIEMAKNEVAEISPAFEPEKNGYTTDKLEAFYSQNSTLLPG
jgi:DNA invertase Pin-like site-specific DNA recombinase